MIQSQVESQFDKAYHVLETISKLQNEYSDLKAEYEKLIVVRSKDKLKEYVGIISTAFPEDRVTSRGGIIRITFKNKNQYWSTSSIVSKIPKVDGKQPMKSSNAKKNSYGEIGWVDLVFTNQFLKSTLNISQLPTI